MPAGCAAKGLPTPILMLTARDAVPDRVAGLEAGADDYLVKPFAVPGADRADPGADAPRRDSHARLSYADLTLDTDARRASRGGRSIELTGREVDLLELLLREPGRTLTRERAIDGDLGRRRGAERRRPLRDAAAAQARRTAADPDGPGCGVLAAGLGPQQRMRLSTRPSGAEQVLLRAVAASSQVARGIAPISVAARRSPSINRTRGL